MFVGAPRHPRRRDHAGGRGTTITSSTETSGCPWTICSGPEERRQGTRPASTRRRPHSPRRMRTIAQCKLAFDMMCERALSRESHGRIIAEHQMVQEKIAESYAAIKMSCRCSYSETAWKIDQNLKLEARTDIAAVKLPWPRCCVRCPDQRPAHPGFLSDHRSHAYSSHVRVGTHPWASPTASIGVHKATVARRVLRGYRPHEDRPAHRVPRPSEKRSGAGCAPSSTPSSISPARPSEYAGARSSRGAPRAPEVPDLTPASGISLCICATSGRLRGGDTRVTLRCERSQRTGAGEGRAMDTLQVRPASSSLEHLDGWSCTCSPVLT